MGLGAVVVTRVRETAGGVDEALGTEEDGRGGSLVSPAEVRPRSPAKASRAGHSMMSKLDPASPDGWKSTLGTVVGTLKELDIFQRKTEGREEKRGREKA